MSKGKAFEFMPGRAVANPQPDVDETEIGRPAEVYDFEYITKSLGLVPICNGSRAINAGAITFIRPRGLHSDSGEHVYIEIGMHNSESFTLSPEEMIELEATIKRREQEAKEARREQIKEQLIAQHEIVRELNQAEMNKVQPGMIINPAVQKRRM